MQFPLSFSDFSLWLALMALLLLVSSELMAGRSSFGNLLIDKSRMRLAAVFLGLAFIFSVAIQAVI